MHFGYSFSRWKGAHSRFLTRRKVIPGDVCLSTGALRGIVFRHPVVVERYWSKTFFHWLRLIFGSCLPGADYYYKSCSNGEAVGRSDRATESAVYFDHRSCPFSFILNKRIAQTITNHQFHGRRPTPNVFCSSSSLPYPFAMMAACHPR